MNKITLDIPRFNFKSPSSLTLKEFGMRFTKDEWKKLCYNQEFMNALLDNLSIAEIAAKRILNKES